MHLYYALSMDWRSEGMGAQENCRDEPVEDNPSGRYTAWRVFVG